MLKKLDVDTGKLVKVSTEREEVLINIDITNIEPSKPNNDEIKLYSEYTNSACDSLVQNSATAEQKQLGIYQEQQSKALIIVFILAALIAFVVAIIVLRKGKKVNFFEEDTGADAMDITAEDQRQETNDSN